MSCFRKHPILEALVCNLSAADLACLQIANPNDELKIDSKLCVQNEWLWHWGVNSWCFRFSFLNNKKSWLAGWWLGWFLELLPAEEKGSEFAPRIWEIETVKDGGMPFKWLIFGYLGSVNVNAEIHSDVSELLRTIPFVQPLVGMKHFGWLMQSFIRTFAKKCSAKSRESLNFFGGFWSRFTMERKSLHYSGY